MLILTVRTDKPEAEIGLYKDNQQLDYLVWQAHRELAETIHTRIKELLEAHSYNFVDLEGLAVFKGPGSFTGLRIGAAVANALAASLNIPVCGASTEQWKETGIQSLLDGNNDRVVMPEYGSAPNITAPRK